MPVSVAKNLIYRAALPFVGRKPMYEAHSAITKTLKKQYAVGGCVQTITGGELGACECAGYARLPDSLVAPDTVFRTASIAKYVTALLVMRLQNKGLLDIDEDISAFLGKRLRNPAYPDKPVTLKHIMSHSSGIQDTGAYERAMTKPVLLDELLNDPALFLPYPPGERFRYSNLAAGMIGSLIELRTGESFEAVMQRELFKPLGINGTFDITKADIDNLANIYRVLPKKDAPDFDAKARRSAACELSKPDPQHHYQLASGNLYIIAKQLAALLMPVMRPSEFLSERGVELMKTPVVRYPEKRLRLYHGLGLLIIDDKSVSASRVIGHQGYAYGSVGGLFYNERTLNGFASLNSGASELRSSHIGAINMALIRHCAADR